MPRPISVLIHLEALQHNIARMREAAQGRTLWAVVKANAYGPVSYTHLTLPTTAYV